jgi:hypothetical protein
MRGLGKMLTVLANNTYICHVVSTDGNSDVDSAALSFHSHWLNVQTITHSVASICVFLHPVHLSHVAS